MKCQFPHCRKRATCWFWIAPGKKGIHACDTHEGAMKQQLQDAHTAHHVLPLTDLGNTKRPTEKTP